MTTQAQVKTSRRQVKKGAGPKSVRSEKVARVPEVRSGLQTEHVVLPWDDREEFEALIRTLREAWRPVGAREDQALEDIVDGRWQLQCIRKTRTSRIRKEFWAISAEAEREEEGKNGIPEIEKFRRLREELRIHFKLMEMREKDQTEYDLFDIKQYDSTDIHQNDIPGEEGVTPRSAHSITLRAIAFRRSAKDLEALSRLETSTMQRIRDAERELERLQAMRRALVEKQLQ